MVVLEKPYQEIITGELTPQTHIQVKILPVLQGGRKKTLTFLLLTLDLNQVFMSMNVCVEIKYYFYLI